MGENMEKNKDRGCACVCITDEDFENCDCKCHDFARSNGWVPLFKGKDSVQAIRQRKIKENPAMDRISGTELPEKETSITDEIIRCWRARRFREIHEGVKKRDRNLVVVDRDKLARDIQELVALGDCHAPFDLCHMTISDCEVEHGKVKSREGETG